MIEAGPQRLALRAVQVFLVAILALSVFLALVVPYHATDALVYGQWSRMIGEHGGFFFSDVGTVPYSRPLFLLPQGWLWWLFGQHEWIGRLFSLAFFVTLLWALFRLARDRTLPPVAPWLAVLVAFALPDVVVSALAGQTDVPVAAMVAVAGVLLWRRDDSWPTIALLVLVGAAAVLAKVTALPALGGLGLAHLLGDRAGLSRRITRGVVPLAAGGLLALVYGYLVARHFDLPLNQFLSGEARTASGEVASGAGRVTEAVSLFAGTLERPAYLLRGEWFGPYARMLVLFGLVYAFARVLTVRHRIAVPVALGLALADYLVGTSVLYGDGSFLDTGAGAVLGSLLLVVPLAGTLWCPPEWIPSRLLLGRLLVWVIPPLIAWGLFGVRTDTRTLSPAWPALIVLAAAMASMGVAGLATRRAWAGAAAIVLVLGLAVLNFRNYDGLGVQPDGAYSSLSALRDLGPSTWTDPDAARSAADPQLGGEVAAARAAHVPGTTVRSNDGRMIFYFLDAIDVRSEFPRGCAELEGVGTLALLTRVAPPEEVQRVSALDCLTPVAGVSGSYGVWRVDR